MKDEQIIRRIAADLQILPKQVKAALALLAAGNTVPFIARYRKEATGLLNEVRNGSTMNGRLTPAKKRWNRP